MIKTLMITLLAGLSFGAYAQNDPVKWEFSAKPAGSGEVELVFKAKIEKGWHLYSQHIGPDGPLPTKFTIQSSSNYTLVGKVAEHGQPIKSHDETFMMDVVWFSDTARFVQKIKINNPAAIVTGNVAFMACTGEMCLPPQQVKFEIPVQPKTKSTGMINQGESGVRERKYKNAAKK